MRSLLGLVRVSDFLRNGNSEGLGRFLKFYFYFKNDVPYLMRPEKKKPRRGSGHLFFFFKEIDFEVLRFLIG